MATLGLTNFGSLTAPIQPLSDFDNILGEKNSSTQGAGLVGFDPSNFYAAGSVGAALNGAVPGLPFGSTINTIATLRTQLKAGSGKAFVLGYFSLGDGGGGQYYYDSTDTTSLDNGGTVIVAADGGRWKLDNVGLSINVAQFGAVPGIADCSSALTAAYGAGFKTYFYPRGTLNLTAPPSQPPASSTHIGQGRYATFLNANFTGGNIGLPVLSFPPGERPSVRDICFNLNYTAAGILSTTAYFGLYQNNAFIGFKGYAVKLFNAAAALVQNNETLYITGMTGSEVGVYCSGGSANNIEHNRFNHQGIAVDCDTSNPAGGSLIDNDVETCVVGFRIPKGSSQWNVVLNYFEDTAGIGQIPYLIGTNGTGANIIVSMMNNTMAGGGSPGTSVIDNCDELTFQNNTCGSLVQFNAGILDMFETQNKYVVTPTRNYARNVRTSLGQVYGTGGYFIQNSVGHAQVIEDATTGGLLLVSLNVAESSYQPVTFDGSSFAWRLGGSTTQGLTMTSAGLSSPVPIYAGALGATPARQSNVGRWGGTGVPSNSFGNNGDIYENAAGGSLTTIYQKRAGSWVGIV